MTRPVPVVTVRLYAAARAAAHGLEELPVDARTLGEVWGSLTQRYGERMSAVLEQCSFLVDQVAVSRVDLGRQLNDGSLVDVLPPFAGG